MRAYRGRRLLKSFDPSQPNSSSSQELVEYLKRELGITVNYNRPHDAPPPASSAASAPVDSGPAYPSALDASVQATMTESKILDAIVRAQPQNFFSYINHEAFVQDHPTILAALNASDQTLVDGLMQFGGRALPDTENVLDMLTRALSCSHTHDRQLKDRLLGTLLTSLTLSQIEALGSRVQGIQQSDAYISAVLQRMGPPKSVDFRTDRAALSAYIERIWPVIDPLPVSYNGTRLTLLYHQLHLIQTDPNGKGRLDTPEARSLFEKYIALPRQQFRLAPFLKDRWDTLSASQAWADNRRSNTIWAIALPTPDYTKDSELITAALTDILASTQGNSLSPWDKYVPDEHLRHIQATAKLLYGTEADREHASDWSNKLTGGHDELKRLQDQVTLSFDVHNAEYIAVGDAVKLHVKVKNIPKVTVSLYEINTTSYYRSNGREVTTDIQLDGLTPFRSYSFDFSSSSASSSDSPASSSSSGPSSRVVAGSPLKMHTLDVPLPVIDETSKLSGGRGVWVAEVVGAGLSSRALIRRGALRFVERRSIAGHLLTVVDEKSAPLPKDRVAVYMAGRRYAPAESAESAEILIPYGSHPSSQNLVVTLEGSPDDASAASASSSSNAAIVRAAGAADAGWSYSTLHSFQHSSETYSLTAAFAVERESIVKDNYSATLLVRPKLVLNNEVQVPLKALEHVTLTITATDGDGATSQRVTRNFQLGYDKESALPFSVPASVRRLELLLTGEVEVIASGGKQSMAASHAVQVNQIDAGAETRDIFLRYTTEKGFQLHVLGKTGEPIPRVNLSMRLAHSLIRNQQGLSWLEQPPFRHHLTTDADGIVTLGQLKGFTSISVWGNWGQRGGQREAVFELPQSTNTYATTVHTITSAPSPGEDAAPPSPASPPGSGGGSSSTAGRITGLLSSFLPLKSTTAAAPASGTAPAPAATVAGTAEIQLRLPFRPSEPTPTVGTPPSTGYVLSRRDLRLVEVRPSPSGENSIQWTDGVDGATVPVADMFQHATYDSGSGFIVIRGLAPGEYKAQVKRPYPGASQAGPEVLIRVLPAASTSVVSNRLACGLQLLQTRAGITNAASAAASCAVQVASVTVDHATKSLLLKITGGAGCNGGPAIASDVRAHVIATHFVPGWDAASSLAKIEISGLSYERTGPTRSRYLNGRKLGEEQMYILDRKERMASVGATPGNLLPRPQLLLNPWSLGPVSTDVQEARSGTEHASYADHAAGGAAFGAAARFARQATAGADSHVAFFTLDFLSRPGVILSNLRPNAATGIVSIPLSTLLGMKSDVSAEALASALSKAGEVFLSIVAADATTTAGVCKSVNLVPAVDPAAVVPPFRDLTKAASSLDPTSHVVQRSRISVLGRPGSTVEVAAAASYTRAEVYTSLDRAAGLLASLSNSPQLQADWMPWMLNWPTLSTKEKRARYSKWTCNETHLYLFFRDPEFFNSVVAPFLSCKRAKTFMDHWLLAMCADPSNQEDAAGKHWESLRAYTRPNVFARLNPMEQALLACSMTPDDAAGVAQFMQDWAEANPITSDVHERVFKAALASNALEASGSELEGMLQQAEAEKKKKRAPAPAPEAPRSVSLHKQGNGAVPGGIPQRPMVMAKSMAMAPSAPTRSMARSMQAMPMAAPSMAMPMAPAPPMALMASMAAPSMAMSMEVDEGCMPDSDEYKLQEALESSDMQLREVARDNALFKPLDKTEEFAESHYYRLRKTSESDTQRLVALTHFWADFATHVAGIVKQVYTSTPGADLSVSTKYASIVAAALRSHPFASGHFPLAAVMGGSGPHGILNDILLTLAVLGLPLERSPTQPPERPSVKLNDDGSRLVYTTGATPAVLFHQDIDAVPAAASSSVLCGQQYLDPEDCWQHVKGQQIKKFLPLLTDDDTGEIVVEVQAGKVYNCHVVISNISSASQQLEVFTHIPSGSLPACNGSMVKMHSLNLGPYQTTTLEYPFYMPRHGTFAHFPVHVSTTSDGELVAYAPPTKVAVVERPTVQDTSSWRYIAANGTEQEIVKYLVTANRVQTDLSQLLWRLHKKEFYQSVKGLLRQRQWWNDQVWAHAFLHGDDDGMSEYLSREQTLRTLRDRNMIGRSPLFTSPLLTVVGEDGVGSTGTSPADANQVVSLTFVGGSGGGDTGSAYEHLEYSPLVNARAHQLGVKRRILNKAVERQYRSLLHVLCNKSTAEVSAADLMAVTYHLLLADRVDEAQRTFERVTPPSDSVAAAAAGSVSRASSGPPGASASWSTLQYDYMSAYLDFYLADGEYKFPIAAAVASAYLGHPVPKWAAKFKELASQLQEAGISITDGAAAPPGGRSNVAADGSLADRDNADESGVGKEVAREAAQSAAVAREPSLEVTAEGKHLVVTYSNLHMAGPSSTNTAPVNATLRVFAMDLELLFSTTPFMATTGAASAGGSSTGGMGSPRARGGNASASGAASGMFAYVRPNGVVLHALPYVAPGKQGEFRIPVPAEFERSNVMCEVVAGGLRRSAAYYSTSLTVTISEPYGRLRVTEASSGRPLPRVYVKVYYTESSDANSSGGKCKFYKDGYTDARGAFDYTALSTDELSRAKRFAVLVASETHGSVVRVASPPGTQ